MKPKWPGGSPFGLQGVGACAAWPCRTPGIVACKLVISFRLIKLLQPQFVCLENGDNNTNLTGFWDFCEADIP